MKRCMVKKPKYKVIQCFVIWNEEADCQATDIFWSEKSALQELEDLERRDA